MRIATKVFCFLCLFSFVFLAALAHPTNILQNVGVSVSIFCQGLTGILPVAAMLMILIAAVIYAAGQMMGAETRSRANVWATASVTGAVMAILIVVITPTVLGTMYGSAVSCNYTPCDLSSLPPNQIPCPNGEPHTCPANWGTPPITCNGNSCQYGNGGGLYTAIGGMSC